MLNSPAPAAICIARHACSSASRSSRVRLCRCRPAWQRLTSLQYRDAPDGTTHEIQSNIAAPARMRIEKRGDYISMWLAAAGEDLKPAGGYLRIPFKGNSTSASVFVRTTTRSLSRRFFQTSNSSRFRRPPMPSRFWKARWKSSGWP